jgi:hypothetical protein
MVGGTQNYIVFDLLIKSLFQLQGHCMAIYDSNVQYDHHYLW